MKNQEKNEDRALKKLEKKQVRATRKQLKKQARARLKKTYWLVVILCLIMALAGIDYKGTLTTINTDTIKEIESSESSIFNQVMTNIISGRAEQGDKLAQNYISSQKKVDKKVGIIAIGHSRGVLADLVNGVSSGNILNTLYRVLHNTTHSKSMAIAFFILLSFLFSIIVNIFIYNIFFVTVKRIMLEFRTYDKVPMNRFLFILRVKRILNVAKTILLTDIYTILWSLTVVGAFIKSRSYMMVPYIMAENPSVKPKQAITLSRRMMDGHKWEAFKLEFSFIGWSFLSFFTYGVTGVLYSNPYKECTKAEFYSHIRSLAKENQIPDVDLLNDDYLYEKVDVETLTESYADVQDYLRQAEGPAIKHTGFRGFMENVFGITFFYDQDEAKYQDKKAKQLATYEFRQVMNQNMYPFRLFTLRNKTHLVKLSSIQYDRHYSIFSVVLIFFVMSFVGWCWEVSLHLVADGKFVNRGVYHGPWLPIYGFGCVLILIFLNKFRTRPLVEFIAGIVLCGLVEYSSAWYLEATHGGTKWWDYSGYFLNIHGRVCAEGLLIFGLGGLAIVYLLAPFLDNHIRKIPGKVLVLVTSVLMVVFVGDAVYSSKHPNTGEGITDYTSSIPVPEDINTTHSIEA